MNRSVIVVLFGLVASVAVGEDNPGIAIYEQFPKVTRQYLRAAYLAEVKRLDKAVVSAKAAIARAKSTDGKEAAKASAEKATHDLDELKGKNDPPFVGMPIEACRGGARMEKQPLTGFVVEVTRHAWQVGDFGVTPEQMRVVQVLEDDAALMERDLGDRGIGDNVKMRFELRGISTEGWTDGSFRVIAEPLWVTGTSTLHATGGGSNTVALVERFDWHRYRKSVEGLKAH